jgi:hypothetical protein
MTTPLGLDLRLEYSTNEPFEETGTVQLIGGGNVVVSCITALV